MSADWSSVRRVLAIRLDSMGDVLMTTPALAAIRQAGCHVTLLTSPQSAAAARLMPVIDEVLTYAAPWMKGHGAGSPEADRGLIDDLAARQFDAAVIFTVFSQTPFPAAMLARLAGIPRILMHARERGYDLASNIVAETEPEQGIRHEVQRQLDLVASVGWKPDHAHLRIDPGPAGRAAARRLVPGDGPWAVMHPGASAPSRRWPAMHFARTAARLAEDHGWEVLLTGSAAERDLCRDIADAAGGMARNLAGKLDLAALAALIARAPVLVCNNTGPAHIAAATATPVVVPYALTNPQHTPWLVPRRVLRHDVPCRWCYASVCPVGHHACMTGIDPERVVTAVLEVTRPDRLQGVS